MTISLSQKIQILLVRLLILPLWLFDLTSYAFFKKPLLAKTINILLITLIFTSPFYIASTKSFKKNISLFYTGINLSINGMAPTLPQHVLQPVQVLGVKTTQLNPVVNKESAFPFISAKAHLVIDNNSRKILSEHNIKTPFAPASTTKLLTALVAMDIYSLNEVIQISDECAKIDSTKLWLPTQFNFKVKDLIYSLLIGSAGDAGCALASSKMSEDKFVELMNKKAKEIGMKDSQFTNPVGLDGENGSHYASVWDLYLLSRKAMANSMIRDIVKTKDFEFQSADSKFSAKAVNTNKLLWEIPNTIGIKTGTTSGAGEVLIYEYNDKEKDLTIIVMSSEDRFKDTKDLLSWTLSTYEWK